MTERAPTLLTGRIPLNRDGTREVVISGYPENGEFGCRTVEIRGCIEGLECMTPETADYLAAALQQAAKHARGETIETALDQFLNRKDPAR